MRRLPAVAVLLAGCLFRNAPAPRYFVPDSAALHAAADGAPAPVPTHPAVPVRLAPVHGPPFLREAIAWRRSAVEYGRYEQRRWVDLPAAYVERAFAAALRGAPGIRLSDDPRALVIDVDVLAFEEVLAPAHVASVAVAVSLRDGGRRHVLDRTFAADEPIASADPAAMAQAMGRALDDATGAAAAAVATAAHGR